MQERLQIILENQQKVYDKIEDTYATKEETKSKFEPWQPNTKYKVGDMVIANLSDEVVIEDNYYFPRPYRTVIAKCIREHTSIDLFYLDNNEFNEAWNVLQETQAYYDSLGRGIHNTYATKEETFGIVRVWKPNTYYKKDDYIHSTVTVDGSACEVLARCNTDHTSQATLAPDREKWSDIKYIIANKAVKDRNDNIIDTTYATKSEVPKIYSGSDPAEEPDAPIGSLYIIID